MKRYDSIEDIDLELSNNCDYIEQISIIGSSMAKEPCSIKRKNYRKQINQIMMDNNEVFRDQMKNSKLLVK